MTEYRVKIKKRLVRSSIMFVLGLLLLGGLLYLQLTEPSLQTLEHSVSDFWNGFMAGAPAGLFCGLLAVMASYLVRYARALKQEDKLKKLYVQEHDERDAFIGMRTMGTSLKVILMLLIAGCMVASFFDFVVTATLFAVIFVAAIVLVISRIYFNKNN